MAAFLAGSNVQADTIQTLHLMNTGYGTCTDAAIGQNDSDSAGYAMPASMVSQSFLSQQSTLAAMYGSHENPLGTLGMANRATPYTWTSSNEVSFVTSNEATQPLASKYVSMTPAEQQFSQFSVARQAEQEGASLGLHAANALSLSLSPQRHSIQSMPYYTSMQSDGSLTIPDLTYVVADKGGSFKGDRIPNLAHLRTLSTNVAPGALHNCMNNMNTGNAHAQAEVSSAGGGFFTGSKYLRAVQHLLNEVVSVEDAIKKPMPSSRHTKSQMWNAYGGSFVAAPSGLAKGTGTEPLNGHSSPGDTSGLIKGMAEARMAGGEGMPWGLSVAKVVSFPDAATSAAPDLTPQARQELQMKKAKLIAMLEEVDRRYKLYRSQMQAIVSLFESAAGVGSAKCYTALALQTISRHFRCLRDAIAGQMRTASKGLGEEDHFSQHRVLQQLHMMQQHAWRPQRGLPERAVSVLRTWLFEHFLHPYPKDADKIMLAKQTGLTRNQVSNWFINARVRLWKPMVEEMYQEEAKEMDGNPRFNETEEEGEESRESGAAAARDARGSTGGSPSQLLANPNIDRGTDKAGETLCTHLHYHPPASSTHNSTLEAMVGSNPLHDAKKARSSLESVTARTAGVYTNLCDLKGGLDDNKLNFTYGPYYTDTPAGGIGRNSSLGALQGSNAISLTLGLQHSGPLEPQHDQSHQPLPYIQHLNEAAASSHGHDTMHAIPQQLADGLLERGNSDPIDISTQNYYSSMATVANLSNSGYEILSQLQNSKEYVGHVLHPDFTS